MAIGLQRLAFETLKSAVPGDIIAIDGCIVSFVVSIVVTPNVVEVTELSLDTEIDSKYCLWRYRYDLDDGYQNRTCEIVIHQS